MTGGRRATDHTYSREMLDEKFKNLDERQDQRHTENQEKLGQILTQTQKTNGRVTKLEHWQWMIIGGLIVIGFIVVPLFLDVLKN